MVSMRYRPGLRLKLNLIVLPILAATMVFFVWLDYRHEIAAVMDAHAMHAGTQAAADRAGLVPAALSPSVVARRALVIHTIHGGVTLALLLLGVNAALSAFILKPLARIQDGIRQMERGQWRTPAQSAGADEVGRLLTNFQHLGLTMDALVSQSLNAERLATSALLAKQMAGEIEPEVQHLGVAAAQLQRLVDPAAQDAAGRVASAAARILAASRRLDRLFDPRPHSTRPTADAGLHTS